MNANATDRLAAPTDNRVEILGTTPGSDAVRVRYVASGTVSTIHRSHLILDADGPDAARVATAEAAGYGDAVRARFAPKVVTTPDPTPSQPTRRVATIEFVRPGGRVRHGYDLFRSGGNRCACGAENDLDARILSNTLGNVVAFPRCAARR